MKNSRTRNGVSPETNSKVLNTLVSGASAGVLALILMRNPEGVKVAGASMVTPLPERHVVIPTIAVPDRIESAMNRIEVKVRSLYPGDAEAIISYIRVHLQFAVTDPCPSFCLAQGGLESDWGRSFLARKNNFFGIKHLKPLSEYSPEVQILLAPEKSIRRRDRQENSNDPYFCFKDIESCYIYRARNLGRLRYQRKIQNIAEPRYYRQWVEAVAAGGWATDKGYTNKICRIIEDLELYLLDS